MLIQLDITNVALIDRISIAFEDGFNIMTGETGAGKSIIIDAINVLLGDRASKDLIRTGKEKASVEAVFQIKSQQINLLLEGLGYEPEEDGTLLISREFSANGKNICRINGKMTTVSVLKEVGELLIDVHGQHDNQSLLRVESHISLLDSFGGKAIHELSEQYSNLLIEYKQVKNKLLKIKSLKIDQEKRIDLYKYQSDEIRKAKLQIGEEENLSKQRAVLSNAEKILEQFSKCYELLYSGMNSNHSACDNITEAILSLGSISTLEGQYQEIKSRLEDISYQLEDVIEDIRKHKDDVDYNHGALEQIEERLDLLFKLKKKYGTSIDEILQYADKIEKELEVLMSCEQDLLHLEAECTQMNGMLYDLATKIDVQRKAAAKLIESKIEVELDDLEIKKAKFKANVEFDDLMNENGERKYTPHGLNKVEFLISPNVGEPLKPLSKIASGGEMSRIMLAMKTILADVDEIPVLIFDEIDSGIGGKAAQKVAEKLSYISKNHQVLCITHLAQISAMADQHYLIEKITEGEMTKTCVIKLKENGIKNEVARILGGTKISEITIKHAEEMIENAKKFKMSQ